MRITIEQKKDQCPLCHAGQCVVIDVNPSGSAYGVEITHDLLCPSRLCEHGVRQSGPIEHQGECAACEEARSSELEEDA